MSEEITPIGSEVPAVAMTNYDLAPGQSVALPVAIMAVEGVELATTGPLTYPIFRSISKAGKVSDTRKTMSVPQLVKELGVNKKQAKAIHHESGTRACAS